jgi:Formyl transferase
LRDAEEQKVFNSLAADVAIVAAYGLILPIPILEAPKLGCLNYARFFTASLARRCPNPAGDHGRGLAYRR